MVNQSLGLIEVVGLAAALEAADAAVKAANVELMGYELTKGGGLVLIKLCGDVGAVTAGVQAGSIAASKVNKVWSTLVIPRPHQQLSCMVSIDSQVLGNENQMSEESEAQPELPSDTEIIETPSSELNNGDDSIVIEKMEKKSTDSCNLCNDPACQRRKGDPKITCIHFGEKINNKRKAELICVEKL